MAVYTVKIKRKQEKPDLEWSQEASRGSSHALPLLSIENPTGREVPFKSVLL